MNTPFLPAFRSRLAALGRRTVQSLRQATLGQLQDQIRDLLPAPLLSSEEDGLAGCPLCSCRVNEGMGVK